MKKIWLLIAAVIGGALVGLVAGLLLPAKERAQVSKLLAGNLERMCVRIPDE